MEGGKLEDVSQSQGLLKGYTCNLMDTCCLQNIQVSVFCHSTERYDSINVHVRTQHTVNSVPF